MTVTSNATIITNGWAIIGVALMLLTLVIGLQVKGSIRKVRNSIAAGNEKAMHDMDEMRNRAARRVRVRPDLTKLLSDGFIKQDDDDGKAREPDE